MENLQAALRELCKTESVRNDLRWWKDESIEPFALASSYINQRLSWISPDYYDKWVSLSFPQFGEIGGYPGCDDGVVGGRSDGHRLLDEAVKQEAAGL